METEKTLPMSAPRASLAVLEETEGGLDVGALIKIIRRKWWLIAGTTALTIGATTIKVLTDTPIYSAQVELLAEAQSTETDIISNVPNTLTAREPETVSGDLIKLLVSPKVLQPVVDGIREIYPSFCPTTNISIEQQPLSANYDPCYRELVDRLGVGAIDKDSNIIRVTYQALDPQAVTVVLDLVSQAYLEYSLESKQADIRRGLDFVEQKLPDLMAKVDSLADQLQTLRISNDLIDPAARGDQLSGQIGQFSQQQLEVQAQLQQARATYSDLAQQLKLPSGQAASSVLDQSPRYQTLLNSLLELDSQIAEASTIYRDTIPEMQVLKEQRDNLLALIQREGRQSQEAATSQIRELEAKDQALNETIQGLNSNIDNLSLVSRQYSDIERELQIATANLSQFLSTREGLEIDAAQRQVPWEIITPPTEPRPQAESLPQNMVLGAVLGLLLGTGAALLIDKSKGVIHTEEDIRRTTNLPILARIPVREALGRRQTEEVLQPIGASIRGGISSTERTIRSNGHGKSLYDSDPFSESFRLLFNNLRLIGGSAQSIKSIVVSSVMVGEGKSTVSIYLAEAAAAMGQRVLLVDADLRNPHIHKYLELSNEKGLTNLFSGEENPDVIQKFTAEPNMYVLCAGSVPFEPSRLLASKGMRQVMEKIEPVFDLIIFDTPPLLGQSDAYLVANHTDGLLLVTRSGALKQSLLDRAMEQLRLADVPLLGVVSREEG